MAKKSKEMGISPVPQLDPEAMHGLLRQRSPGNVRELENAVERSLIQQRQGPLSFHRPQELRPENRSQPAIQVAARMDSLDEMIRSHILKALQTTGGKVSGGPGAAALLGVHPNTLRNRMQKLGIEFGRKRKERSD